MSRTCRRVSEGSHFCLGVLNDLNGLGRAGHPDCGGGGHDEMKAGQHIGRGHVWNSRTLSGSGSG